MTGLKAAMVIAALGGGAILMAQAPPSDPLESVAERYVTLVLAVGQSSPRLPSGLK